MWKKQIYVTMEMVANCADVNIPVIVKKTEIRLLWIILVYSSEELMETEKMLSRGKAKPVETK